MLLVWVVGILGLIDLEFLGKGWDFYKFFIKNYMFYEWNLVCIEWKCFGVSFISCIVGVFGE